MKGSPVYTNLFQISTLLWICISLPLRVWFFGSTPCPTFVQSAPHWILILDGLVDLWHFVHLIYHRTTTDHHNLSTWVYTTFEVCATVPLDLLAVYVFQYPGPHYGLLRLPKLLLLAHVPKLYDQLIHLTWKTNVQLRRIVVLFLLLTTSCHWAACFWHSLGIQTSPTPSYRWPQHDPHYPVFESSSWHQYLRAMYFTCITMSTVGFGDIVPVTSSETLFTLVIVFIGMTMSCASIANITSLLYTMDAQDSMFQTQLDTASACMQRRHVPLDVQHQVMAFLRYTHRVHHPLENHMTSELESLLPDALRQKMTRERQNELFRNIPVLASASNALRAALSCVIEAKVFAPGEIILEQDQVLDGLVYIKHGVVHCLRLAQRTGQLEAGSYVGEDILFRRTTTADDDEDASTKDLSTLQAASFCECLWLSRENFERCLEAYDGAAEIQMFLRRSRVLLDDPRHSRHSFLELSSQVVSDGHTFHPESNFRQGWTALLCLGVLLNVLMIPPDIACAFTFPRDHETSSAVVMLLLQLAIELVFLIDLILNLTRFAFIREDGIVMTKSHEIQRHYVFSLAFVIDVGALVPLDLVVLIFQLQGLYTFLPLLRLNKTLRLVHLHTYFVTLETLVISRLHIRVFVRRVIQSLILLFLSGYLAGALWLLLPAFQSTGTRVLSWVDLDLANPNEQCGIAFTRAIYFAFIGTSTLGLGDIVPVNVLEVVYVTILMLYGAMMKPAVVGGIASLLLHQSRPWKDHCARVLAFHALARAKSLDLAFTTKVHEYLDYLWSNDNLLEGDRELLGHLPPRLRGTLVMHMTHDVLFHAPVFRLMREEFVMKMYGLLNPKLTLDQESVLESRKSIEQFVILEHGQVEIRDEHHVLHVKHHSTNHHGRNQAFPKNTSSFHSSDLDRRCFGYEIWMHEKEVEEQEGEERSEPLQKKHLKTRTLLSSVTIQSVGYCEWLVINKHKSDAVLAEETSELRDWMALRCEKEVRKLNTLLSRSVDLTRTSSIVPLLLKYSPSSHGKTSAAESESTRYYWDMLVFTVLLYNSILIPFRCAYFIGYESSLVYLYGFFMDYVLDVILIADVYAQWQVFSLVQHGRQVSRRREVQHRLVRSWAFRLTVLATLPIDWIVMGVYHVLASPRWSRSSVTLVLTCARLSKCLKLPAFLALFPTLEQRMTEWKPHWKHAIVITKVLVYISLLSHSLGCMWHLVAVIEQDMGHVHQTWIHPVLAVHASGNDNPSLSYLGRYLGSIYFSLQMLLVVISGDVVPETVLETGFCIVTIFTGVLVSAAMIGLIAEHVLALDESSVLHQADALSEWLKRNLVPRDVRQRAAAYFTSHSLRSCPASLTFLPPSLRQEIVHRDQLECLRESQVFGKCSRESQEALASVMTSRAFAPGDVVSYRDRVTRSMYFFQQRGLAEIQPFDEKDRRARSRKGHRRTNEQSSMCFGARSLFLGEPQQYTVCAADYTEVYVLKARDMESIFCHDPTLRQACLERLVVDNNEPDSPDPQDSQHNMGSTRRGLGSKSNMDPRWKLDTCLCFGTLYLLIIVPLRLGCCIHEERTWTLSSVCCWFSLDLVIQGLLLFKTFVIREDRCGEKTRYTWCVNNTLRLLSLSPVPLLLVTLLVVPPSSLLPLLKYIFAPALVQIRWFGHYARYLRFSPIIASSSSSGSRVISCLVLYLLVSHLCACIWMGLHHHSHDSKTWLTEDPMFRHVSPNAVTSYLRAFYFSLQFISTVGYGDIRPQRPSELVFRLVETFLGAFLFASLIASLANYFRYRDAYLSADAKLARLASYLSKERSLSQSTTREIEATAKLLWQHTGGNMVEAELTKGLPVPLQMEIAQHVKHTVLNASPILSRQEPFLRGRLALALRYQVAVASQLILSKGDLICELLFLQRGRVQVGLTAPVIQKMSTHHIRPRYGSVGDHFGRPTTGACAHSIRAVEHCELYVLDERGIKDVLDHMPHEERRTFCEELDATSVHHREDKSLRIIPDSFHEDERILEFVLEEQEEGGESEEELDYAPTPARGPFSSSHAFYELVTHRVQYRR